MRITLQAPSSEADQQHIELTGQLEELARGRTRSGDHLRMIVRRDDRQTLVRGEARADLLAALGVAVVEEDLAAVLPGRAHLGRRSILRHHDRRRDALQPARKCHGLRVIARGVGDHSASTLLAGEGRNGVIRATKLERAATLQVLAFEEELAARSRVRRSRGQDRRAMRDALEPRRGRLDVGECDG
jgi:hypothetical protein